ncbi:MAG TPA: proton-conducting transporter membrane subunit [Mycobacteriales bacterium]|nr:proton-conducting transporter membrane subunit [Mycobacteriales bacterium]
MHFNDGLAQLAPVSIAIPIIVACVLLSIGHRAPRPLVDGTAIAGAAAVVGLDAALFAGSGGRVINWIGNWLPGAGHPVGIVFVVDRIGAGIALLAATLMLLAMVYSARYFESADAHYHCLMMLFLAGMNGFALTGDLFDMFVFFELMGAAAYALTGFKVEDRSSLQGALNFGIVNSLGAYVTLMGIGLVYAHTGQLGLAQIGASLNHQRVDALIAVGFVLVISGWLVKAAAVPFHFWLDDAHAAAPTPVCVLFSGVMVELGLYGVLRVYWSAFAGTIPVADVRRTFIVLGAVTALVGAVMCLAQRHLKRLLAFSTIAHMGLFMCAAGTMGAAGTTGAAVYVAGHAGAKCALFLLAGMLLNRYGSVDEVTLHGRARDAPVLAVLFGIAALALAGLPPFGSALGKAIGEDALSANGYWFGPVLFVAVSAMTGGAALRAGGRIFLGIGPRPTEGSQQTTGDEEQPETIERFRARSVSLVGPIIVLLAGSLAIGVDSSAVNAIGGGAERMLDHAGYLAETLRHAVPRPIRTPAGIGWTTKGVVLGLVSTVLAVSVATIGWYIEPITQRFASALSPFQRGIAGIRALHSGHVGDYVAWLMVGVVALGALVGLPLR